MSNWGHTGVRHPTDRHRLFPALEATPDLSRGDQRFAAEVALAELHGADVPSFAHDRAVGLLGVMARG